MSIRPWSVIVAIGLILGSQQAEAVEGGRPAPKQTQTDSQSSPGESHKDSADDNQPTRQTRPVSPIQSAIKPEADAEIPKPNKNYGDCQFQSIEECDLAAQQSMAKSTSLMNAAAWLGVLFTLVGLGMLYRTLVYTRAAAEQSQRAADSAQSSISVTQETAYRTLRAYVVVESVEGTIAVGKTKITGHVTVALKNTGVTPAHFQVFMVRVRMPDSKTSNQPHKAYLSASAGGRELGKDGTYILEREFDFPFEDVFHAQAGSKRHLGVPVEISFIYLDYLRERHSEIVGFIATPELSANVREPINLRFSAMINDNIAATGE
jgi:hypothetical protein